MLELDHSLARDDAAVVSENRWVGRLKRVGRRDNSGSIIKPGRNAWRADTALRLSFLIDGASYFSALDSVLRKAKKTIWIIGWDFNPDIRLRPRHSSETLGELLLSLVDEHPELQIRILVWGMGPVYSGKSLRLFRESRLSAHPQIDLRFDLRHPLRACHHQKLVVIDDNCAFLGGIDLTARRWDEPDHRPDNPLRRSPEGESYGAVHDMQAAITGPAAKLVGDVARRRWQWATGKVISPCELEYDADQWPACMTTDMSNVNAAVALTEPGLVGRRGRHEAVRLTRDAIKAAKRHIYIETQYLASFNVARAIAARLREEDGPEIVVVVTKSSHGLIEKLTMGNNRDRLIRKLKRIDVHDRLRVLYPTILDDKEQENEILVHSKLIVVDEQFVRIGSSNLNHRSEGLDTECDMAVEASSDDHRQALNRLRNSLLAEHLDADVEEVSAKVSQTGSLISAIDFFNVRKRRLCTFAVDIEQGEVTPMPGTSLVDPRRPFRFLREVRLHASLIKARFGSIFL
ncbi:phospholipase D-like domain-containing protein [Oryzifoliimicrobium ureilyticus]|uniref:phospholipase D-like domain-containing protein n=1 Tax=Oryzifoliimicrobium ureilyticus TaxID=3113724 RepID=UPI003076537A